MNISLSIKNVFILRQSKNSHREIVSKIKRKLKDYLFLCNFFRIIIFLIVYLNSYKNLFFPLSTQSHRKHKQSGKLIFRISNYIISAGIVTEKIKKILSKKIP